MIYDMIDRANADPVLRRQAQFVQLAFGLDAGSAHWIISIDKGTMAAMQAGDGAPVPEFTLSADEASWADFALPLPPPGTHDVLALFEGGRLKISGEALPLMRNLAVVKAVLAKLRQKEMVQ
jgi:putative sterol carrier protein